MRREHMSKHTRLVQDDIGRVKSALSNIDWSFYPKTTFVDSELKPFNPRKYHWYPATFVPEIPFTLVEVLTSPEATIYDPFSGIGTTYFQSLLLNRKPVATEICEVAVRFTENMHKMFDPNKDVINIYQNISDDLGDYSRSSDYTTDVSDDILLSSLRPWYSEKDFNELCYLFKLEEEYQNEFHKAALQIVISNSLWSQSSQDRGWGCIADNMVPENKKYKGVVKFADNELKKLVRDVRDRLSHTGEHYQELYSQIEVKDSIHCEDVRSFSGIPDQSVDLVVTSPPYPEMTDYVSAQRLSYYWLGEKVGLSKEYNDDMNIEIGARRKRGRDSSVEDYRNKMEEANENIVSKLSPGGYLCYVLPKMDEEDTERKEAVRGIIEHINNMEDMNMIDEYSRIIPSNKRSHNVKWTSVSQERISLFKRR
jgi:DNA modification methylase